MDLDNRSISSLLNQKVTECYSSQGYEVIHEPNIHQMPFDLDRYLPDILVKKSEDQGFIVEIKDTASNLSINRYCELAKTIAEHRGWRFLLVTGEDATPIAEEDIGDNPLTRSEILKRKERIAKLISIGEREAAFISLWIYAEVLMRRHARQLFIPIDRFATTLMIHHLYRRSEITPEQFDKTIALNEIRNRVAHGFPVKAQTLNEAIENLLNLVDEFIVMQT